MRFEVHQVLDAIEQRLTTDPVAARAVLDLSEVVRLTDLDNTRPANLLRLGMVVDALARHLAEEEVQVYAVAGRTLLSDGDLTSNERMRIRSWSDDGLVEVLPDLADRVLEVADLTGLPVISRGRYDGLRDKYPWLISEPGRILAPVPGAGGAALISRGAPGTGRPGATATVVMSRLWRCPERGCASFGDPAGPGTGRLDDTFAHLRGGTGPGVKRRPGSQPPPRLRAGTPVCPRHDTRLSDAGPRPVSQAVSVRVDGVLKRRFVVTAGHPVVVGRSPDEPDSVMLGHLLEEEARSWISRRHLRLEIRGDALYVTDTSTNGTVVKRGGSEFTLHRDQSHVLGPDDELELYEGVELARSGHWAPGGRVQPASVMTEAPTITMRRLNL
ncbi:MAG: FHA domain-containing protein [Micromonosporaceae bacterium]|nr:FHA domain-containing protein [Micromonosporaceae bacterium]